MNGVTDVGGTPLIATGTGSGDCFGGGGWIGMLLVLALLGGGLGFGRDRDRGGREDQITNDFLYTTLNTNNQTGFTNLQDQINNQFVESELFGLSKEVALQGERTNNAIDRVGYQNALGQRDIIHSQDMQFCGINRNIDGIRFENERNTSRVIESQDRNTQRILDQMKADELRLAYAKIAEQNQALSEARIIAAMKPKEAVPAYLQPSPYEAYQVNPAIYGAGRYGCGAI